VIQGHRPAWAKIEYKAKEVPVTETQGKFSGVFGGSLNFSKKILREDSLLSS
jgi:hypothetical protein